MTPETRAALMAELTRDEGVRLKAYRDTVGKLTIGIGRNLDDVGISEPEARFLLSNDIDVAERELLRSMPWAAQLDPVRFRVLMNMAFNLGIARLTGFRETLQAVQAGDYETAAVKMLRSRWADQVGERARRLAAMMRTGVA